MKALRLVALFVMTGCYGTVDEQTPQEQGNNDEDGAANNPSSGDSDGGEPASGDPGNGDPGNGDPGNGDPAGDPTARMLGVQDLIYQGAFKVPSGRFGTDTNATFSYSDEGLAYNAANNSLFVKGHRYGQLVAEISIPAPSVSSDLTVLPTATVLQNFADITEGHREDESVPNGVIMGGLLVHGGELIGAVWGYYDNRPTLTRSHFTSGLGLADPGDFHGLFAVGSQLAAYVGGAMTAIPTEWQTALGGPVLTGHCCSAIISNQSSGPSAWVMDPADLGLVTPAPATPMVYYPYTHANLGSWSDTAIRPVYNMTTRIPGLIFPTGTRSVLFFGSTGLGKPCYGIGTSNQSLDGTPSGSGDIYCYDPDDNNKGTHAYPYSAYVWIYDANELVAVKQGQKQPWDVTPATHGPLSLPFNSREINGAAYDPVSQKIYVAQRQVDRDRPVIHVFQIGPQ